MGRVRGNGDAERWLQWKWREGAIPRPQEVQEGGADVEGNQELLNKGHQAHLLDYFLSGTIQTDYHHSFLTHWGKVLPFSIIVIASTLIKCIQLLCNRRCFINNCAYYHGKLSFSVMLSHQISGGKKKALTQSPG